MRSLLALPALALLALAAVPTASATLAETTCIPETSSTVQACVRQHVSPGLPTDPSPTDVCVIAGDVHGPSVYACVLLFEGNGDDCLAALTSVTPPLILLCV